MFRNRVLQIKVVEDQPPRQPAIQTGHTLHAGDALEIAEIAIVGAAIILGTYLFGDTVRQVVIHTAQVKIK